MDLTKTITDLKGAEIKDQTGEALKLGDVLTTALLIADGKSEDHFEKLKKYRLALKLQGATASLQMEEKDLLRTQVSKNYGPLIVGRVCEELYGSI